MIKKRYILLTIIICLFCISSASANEITNDMMHVDNNLLINEEINVQQDDVLATSYDKEVIYEKNNEWQVNDSIDDTELIKIPYDNLQKSCDTENDILISTEIPDNESKSNPTIDFNAYDIIVGETLEIKVFLPYDATGNVTVLINNETFSSSIDNGSAIVQIDGLPIGVCQNFTICYEGDDKYLSRQINSSIDVYPIEKYEITASNATIYFDETANIVVNVPSDAKGSVVLLVGSNIGRYESQVANGEAKFEISDFPNPNDYVFIAFLSDDPKYEYNEITGTITVKPLYNYSMVTEDVDISVNETAYIIVNLPEDAEGEVHFTIANQSKYVTVQNGTAKMNVSNLEAGNYTFNASYSNYDYYYKYGDKSVTGTLRVHKIPITTIECDEIDINISENFKIEVFLPEDATGNVTVAIYNKTFTSPVNENGQAIVLIDEAPADINQKYTIYYSGDNKYLPYQYNRTFDIFPIEEYEITANNQTIDFGKTATITVNVPSDAKGTVELSATIGILDRKKYESPAINGTATFEISGFTNAGAHYFTAYLIKDPKYAYNEVLGKIYVNPVNNYSMIANDVDAYVNETAYLVVNLPEDAKENVYFIIGTQREYIPIQNGTAKMEVSNFEAGNYTYTAIYDTYEDHAEYYYTKYGYKSTNGTLRVHKIPITTINFYQIDTNVNENFKIQAFLPEDATGNLTVAVFNKTYTSTVNENGHTIVQIDEAPLGIHECTIYYSGDNKYTPCQEDTTIDIFPIENYGITVNNPKIDFGETAKFIVNVPSDAKGIVELSINMNEYKTYETRPVNGTAIFEISDFTNAGTIYFWATLTKDPKYETESVLGEIYVAPLYNYTIIANDIDAYVNETAYLIVNISQDVEGKIYFEVGNQSKFVPIQNGTAIMEVSNFEAGNYTYRASYDMCDDFINYYFTKYGSKRTEGTLRVHKISNYKMNTSDIYIKKGETAKIIVNLPSDANGTASVRIYNEKFEKNISAEVQNGQIIVDVKELEKNSQFEIEYLGNYKYESNKVNGSIFIEGNAIIEAPDLTKFYKGPEKFVVMLKDSNHTISNADINITINGKQYTRTTDNKGIASMAINLNSGVYKVTTEYDGTKVYSTVTIKSTINGNDVNKVEKAPEPYVATFTDSAGKILTEKNARFNINGVFYDREINATGQARLNLNLGVGEYIITALNPETGEESSNIIKINSRFANNTDVTKYYRNDTQYYITLLGDDGKPAGAGESVTFNINGVMYERQTNANGSARMNINLNPGEYVITAIYKGCMISNKIKVLPIITAKDLVMKFQDGHKFEAKLVDGQGKPMVKENITFNINGVFYNRTTDVNGIARLNINLMAGEYIITSYYGTFATSNKITIRS